MNLDALHLFVDVAHRGSFAAVARARGLDPSSVSRTIASLERELGIGLFDRTTRRLALTEAGAAYHRRVEPLLDGLMQAADVARGGAARARGTLRVLAPVSFAQLNLVPLLPAFLAAQPDVSIDLQLTDALLDLVEQRVDVAIRLGPLADSSYVARRLAPMRSHVCASPAYLARRGRPATPADLADHPCLLLDMPGFGRRWRFRPRRDGAEADETQVDVGASRITTSNAIALKQCALAGQGVILQGGWIVGRELAEGTLVDLFPDHEATASHFDNAAWSLRPARTHEPAKVGAFLAFLHQAFADGAPWARSDASGA